MPAGAAGRAQTAERTELVEVRKRVKRVEMEREILARRSRCVAFTRGSRQHPGHRRGGPVSPFTASAQEHDPRCN